MGFSIRIPISFKLAFMTVSLILIAVFVIATQNSKFFESTFSKSQHDANADLANSKSTEVEGLVFHYLEKIRVISNILLKQSLAEKDRAEALDMVFFHDFDFVNLDIYRLETNGKVNGPVLTKRLTNEAYLKELDLDKTYIDRLRRERAIPFAAVFSSASEEMGADRIQILNTTLAKGAPLFTIAAPLPDSGGGPPLLAVADVRMSRLQRAFLQSGARTAYLVDRNGFVLAHSRDDQLVMQTQKLELPIVEDALDPANRSNKGQKKFFDNESNQWWVGAYAKTAFGLTVLVQAPEQIILEPARLVKLEAYRLAGYVLSGALFLVILFSMTLTNPIERLHLATILVSQGNFNIQAKVRSHDEVGELAMAFNKMVGGLKERDKVKNILTKFHGSSITEDLIKNDLKLGGSRKTVTVFFSDIREFTKFSENHTPEEVVEMLNEYFQVMVSIIAARNGVVDKFVGDAIMAIWGAPTSTGHDSYHAVVASLEMRMALNELNEKRIARRLPPIKIGMGVHTGPAISGKIGSTERMEYTVIGDTVNMASRIESSTKAFGTDLLISEAVVKELEGQFLFDLAGEAEVKGKSEPLKMFKVRGYFDADGKPIELKTPYSEYEAGHADKIKVTA